MPKRKGLSGRIDERKHSQKRILQLCRDKGTISSYIILKRGRDATSIQQHTIKLLVVCISLHVQGPAGHIFPR